MEKKEYSAAEKIAAKLIDKKRNQLLPVLKAAVLGQRNRFKKANRAEKSVLGNSQLN